MRENTTKVVTANTSKHRKKKAGMGEKVSEYNSAFYKLIEEIDSKLQSGRALDMNYLNITYQTF